MSEVHGRWGGWLKGAAPPSCWTSEAAVSVLLPPSSRDISRLSSLPSSTPAIYAATMILSLVIANNAAAAIVFPIAATVAVKVGIVEPGGGIAQGWETPSSHWLDMEAACLTWAITGSRRSCRPPLNPWRPVSACRHGVQDNIDVYFLTGMLPCTQPTICTAHCFNDCRTTSTSTSWPTPSCWAPPPCLPPPSATRWALLC